MIDRLLSTIAPHSCCGCGLVGEILCDLCKNDIISDPFSRCVDCLGPTMQSNLCTSCRSKGYFDDAWCAGARADTLKQLIDTYKFSATRGASDVCAELLCAQLPVLPPACVIVPVPTASAHRRVRGFGHMELVAHHVAKERKLPFSTTLQRTDNQTQHFKSRKERLKLSAESFRTVDSVPEVILLVDDIYTTGATLRACAHVLRSHGAKQVFVAVIARQVLDEVNDL